MESFTAPLAHFKEQFSFVPIINHSEHLKPFEQVVVCGMGGSAITVNLLKLLFQDIPVTLHNSYGLPTNYDKKNTLFILNSYSGTTEEILDAYVCAQKEGAMMACLSLGGDLIEYAKRDKVPYIQLPQSSLEPRFSIGHQLISLLHLMKKGTKITMLTDSIDIIDLENLANKGKDLAEKHKDTYLVLYATQNLYPITYLIKAALNEGAKIPSFASHIPEANHNELQSFVTDDTRNTSKDFSFLFYQATFDHVRNLKRFSIMNDMYSKRSFITTSLTYDHTNITSLFEAILTGYFMATYIAHTKGVDPYKTPLIQEFKHNLTH
jgi:glucose/mannose-6-phosphate isomerase